MKCDIHPYAPKTELGCVMCEGLRLREVDSRAKKAPKRQPKVYTGIEDDTDTTADAMLDQTLVQKTADYRSWAHLAKIA